ncbi:uncharacterized protein [Rhodnius prolixus]|uniref:Protein triatoma dimidiata n=1 Tax=Rhodnius prolixus TaxID=13249 RepID=A0A4V0Y8S7_RHOPR
MNDYKFSIMIISTQKFCERLKQSIIHISEKLYNDDIKLKLAENVADIINSEKPDTGVDFVAIVVDTTVPNAIEKCKRDISLIMPMFVASKMCIINGSCREGSIDLAKELIVFVDEYSIPYFNGQIMDNLSCRVTAERIIKVAAFSCGYNSGIPGILPTPNDLGLIS